MKQARSLCVTHSTAGGGMSQEMMRGREEGPITLGRHT